MKLPTIALMASIATFGVNAAMPPGNACDFSLPDGLIKKVATESTASYSHTRDGYSLVLLHMLGPEQDLKKAENDIAAMVSLSGWHSVSTFNVEKDGFTTTGMATRDGMRYSARVVQDKTLTCGVVVFYGTHSNAVASQAAFKMVAASIKAASNIPVPSRAPEQKPRPALTESQEAVAYYAGQISKYRNRFKWGSEDARTIVQNFGIRCENKAGRRVPLMHLLAWIIGGAEREWGIHRDVYTESIGKEARIFIVDTFKDGRASEHLTFTINSWGEIRGVGGVGRYAMNGLCEPWHPADPDVFVDQ